MRIVHVADLHIRNFKYRDEYYAAFADLYGKVADLKPDLIVNAGDTVHSKLAVSPELFDDVADHCVMMGNIAPYWMILGNHDLNLKNKGRTDAISPIVRAIRGRTKHDVTLMDDRTNSILDHNDPFWWEKSPDGINKNFWHYDIRGLADPSKFKVNPEVINIGIYHGSIAGCVTDMGFVMEEGEAEVKKFDQMDFVLLGDIHKRQSFRDGRIQYPGSLIQQNYGEEVEKGFLCWDIHGKDDFEVNFHPVRAPGRFHTISVPSTLDLADLDVPEGSRIRAVVAGELTPSQRMKLERDIRARFKPLEVMVPDSSGERPVGPVDVDLLVESRETMMRSHLKERGASDELANEAIRLFGEYEKTIEEAQARGTTWKLTRFGWNNMFNYGEDNSVDMAKVSGIVGIFAPNASGKSSIFDILTETFFDRISKDAPRNIDLINDNKDLGTMSAEFEAGDSTYTIERSIERIHYGQRKFTETKQWGRTDLEFTRDDDSLNGTSRPETERAIRSVIGTFEDFALTTMLTQKPIFGLPGGADIINCRETDRRKILFRFLDLDVYERISVAMKNDISEALGRLKKLDRTTVEGLLERNRSDRVNSMIDLKSKRELLMDAMRKLSTLEAQLAASGFDELTKLRAEMQAAEKARSAALAKHHEKNERLIAARKKLEKTRQMLSEDQKLEPERPTVTLSDLSLRLESLRRESQTTAVEISQRSGEIDRGKRSLKTLEDIPCEGRFPSCRFISDATSYVARALDIEQALADLQGRKVNLGGEIASLEAHEVKHRDVAAWEKRVQTLRMQEQIDEAQVQSLERETEDSRVLIETIRAKLSEVGDRYYAIAWDDTLVDAKKQADSEVRQLQSEYDSLLKRVGVLDSDHDKIQADLKSLEGLEERAKALEFLAEMVGKNGLPYRILTLALPIINQEIARILTGIVKFSVFFEDDPEEQTVSLYIRYGDYKSRPLSLGSGAENFIASIAVRVALLSVSSLPKTDMLIIDEGFGKLDPEHLESLQRMFEYLREAFGTVFIVSHVDSMRDIVDHSIEITSQDGYAHVEVS